jgi:WD40 repeat protein
VHRASFSPDGRRVLTLRLPDSEEGGPGAARLWDAATGEPLTPPRPHDALTGGFFTPDGRLVVLVGGPKEKPERTLWDPAGGDGAPAALPPEVWRRFEGFTLDGRLLAVNREVEPAEASVWDFASGRRVSAWEVPAGTKGWWFSRGGGRVLARVEQGKQHEVRVWEAATGKPLASLAKLGEVWHAALSPDGRRALVWAEDEKQGGSVRVWDVDAGTPLGRAMPHHQRLLMPVFSPDSRHAVVAAQEAASGEWLAVVWDPASGQVPFPPPRHPHHIDLLLFNPDGSRLVTVGSYNTLRAWDTATGRQVNATSWEHEGSVYQVVFAPDGRVLASAGADGHVRLWDVMAGRPEAVPLPHGTAVDRVAFSPDGTRLLAHANDHTVRLWDLTPATHAPPLDTSGATEARFSPCGRFLLTLGRDGTARVHDAVSGRLVSPPWKVGDPAGLFVGFSPDGGRVVLAGEEAGVWDVTTGREAGPRFRPGHPVSYAGWGGGRLLLGDAAKGVARAWDTAAGAALTPELKLPASTWRAALSADGRRVLGAYPAASPFAFTPAALAPAEAGGQAVLWDADTGRPLGGFTGRPVGKHRGLKGQPVQGAFSPDGRRLVTIDHLDATTVYDGVKVASMGAPGCVWDAGTGAARTPPFQQSQSIRQAEFSPDGTRLVTANAEEVVVRDADTGGAVGAPLRPRGTVTHASFSPDGRRVLTLSQPPGGAGGEARVWEASDGRPLTQPLRHPAEVKQAAFSPDGLLLATLAADGAVRVWEVATSQPLAPPLRLPPADDPAVAAPEVLFAADGLRVLVHRPGRPGDTRVWDLTPDARPVEALLSLTELLSGRRVTAGSLEPLDAAGLRERWRTVAGAARRWRTVPGTPGP